MKRIVTIATTSFYAVMARASGGDFTIADPTKGIFTSDSKVTQIMHTAEWIVKGGAGLFAISCFVSAGNMARQGQYGRAGGAAVGGIIASIGAYLVHLSQA